MKRRRVVEVEFDEDTLTVTYDRDALFRAIAEGAPRALPAPTDRLSTDRLGATVDALVESIVSWDLTDDDGRPCPIDREIFDGLPISALYKIDRAISADALDEGD
jgi:hypothetical protein